MEQKIEVYIKNGLEKKTTADPGCKVSIFLNELPDKNEIIAARVNNETTSLSYKIKVNSTIEFLTIKDNDGMEIYRRTLSFLLEKAICKLFPGRKLVIGHSLGPGYYFDLQGDEITADDVKLIENEMIEEIKADKEILREKISYVDALEYFKKNNREDKYRLISTLNMPQLSIYKCDDFFEMFDLPLANRTGILNVFKLIYYPPGFILQFPKRFNIKETAPFTEQKKIFEVYQKNKRIGKTLNIDNVGGLNQIILNNQLNNLILIEEALHSKMIISLANEVYKRKNETRLVCIAGPSSSGKTTFSKRFDIQLKALGLNPVTISVDNYFVDRDKTIKDENGNPDYESINAINLELFNDHLKKLLNGGKINLPVYNFITGKSIVSDEEMSINKNDIIIIEGIHCLNEKLTYSVSKSSKYKIYVSVLTQMNIDNNNRLPTTDNRIIRRIVRDFKYRGHSALKTIKMWPSVRRGEEDYIFPFQNNADGYFNSALDYELSILRPYAEPLLMQVKPYDEEFAVSHRLMRFLSYFLPTQSKDVPSTSILREFIGGSSFRY